MKNGCLVYASNNENGDIDYVRLANESAKNIERLLNIPVSVVTDKEVKFKHNFDQVILTARPKSGRRYFHDFDGTIQWLNGGRFKSFDLTPYDRTMVLDADYIVASNVLSRLFESNQSFLTHESSYEITGHRWFSDELNYFGQYRMPMNWATIMYFEKSIMAETIFSSMKMIEGNYRHYADLYNFNSQLYRNDYALSIAVMMANGHFNDNKQFYIPWHLASVVPEHKVTQEDTDTYKIEYEVNDREQYLIVTDFDLHVIGKTWLKEMHGI